VSRFIYCYAECRHAECRHAECRSTNNLDNNTNKFHRRNLTLSTIFGIQNWSLNKNFFFSNQNTLKVEKPRNSRVVVVVVVAVAVVVVVVVVVVAVVVVVVVFSYMRLRFMSNYFSIKAIFLNKIYFSNFFKLFD
jgi:hypothetical protein